MEEQTLIVQLMPDYNFTAESMGYNIEEDDIDENGVLFQQGFNIVELAIAPGDGFDVPENYERGTVSLENQRYRLIKNEDWQLVGDENRFSDIIVLKPGRYVFHSDGITIEIIELY